jgi:hypothetical protein
MSNRTNEYYLAGMGPMPFRYNSQTRTYTSNDTGPENTPIRDWDQWVPIFNQLGIDPANIPDFAPLPVPENPTQPGWWHYSFPGVPPGNDIASNGANQSPAALSQAGLALAQLGQPTQPTWMAQQPQQQMPQGLLSPQGPLTTPQISASTTDLQYLRGLLNPYAWGD